MLNESKFLTEKYKGQKWDDLIKDFKHHHVASHTVKYNDQTYFVDCDRLDICKGFIYTNNQ